MAGLVAQDQHNFFKPAVFVVGQFLIWGDDEQGHVFEVFDDFASQRGGGRDHIGEAGIDRTEGHAIKFGGSGFLHKNRPGLFLDRAQPQHAIRTHAGKDHADTVLLPICGQ